MLLLYFHCLYHRWLRYDSLEVLLWILWRELLTIIFLSPCQMFTQFFANNEAQASLVSKACTWKRILLLYLSCPTIDDYPAYPLRLWPAVSGDISAANAQEEVRRMAGLVLPSLTWDTSCWYCCWSVTKGILCLNLGLGLGWLGDLQVFCIFLFLTAVSLFGTLISQLNEIVAKQTSQTKELDYNLELYLDIQPRWMLRGNGCQHWLESDRIRLKVGAESADKEKTMWAKM